MREEFFLEMMQRRLASDDSVLLSFNRAVIHDMLIAFSRQRAQYIECQQVLSQYACNCTPACGNEHWGQDYCGFLARQLSGEKDSGSVEVRT